jgi:hypothetical protein
MIVWSPQALKDLEATVADWERVEVTLVGELISIKS